MKASEYNKLPNSPGVYLMKNKLGLILYIGKAVNLKKRVSSYFLRANDTRITKLVSEVSLIDYIKTRNALEALILEAKFIKKHSPPYNIKEKDDKSFLYIEITKEKFPRVLLVRGKSVSQGDRFGPFTSASHAREAVKILRKIFQWNMHIKDKVGTYVKPCFDYEIGLCPGTCVSLISHQKYMKNISRLKLFLSGKSDKLLSVLTKEMYALAKDLNFEDANKIKKQIFALTHIQDTALISEPIDFSNTLLGRIEGYDISNISGDSASGAMVVFINGVPNKDEYRRFKIRSISTPNDVLMIREIISRRLKNNWPLPSLMLIDGGIPQVNAVKEVLINNKKNIPVIGMIKGKKRNKTDLIGDYVTGVDKKVLELIRDEAHRFAISYHRKIRHKKYLDSAK